MVRGKGKPQSPQLFRRSRATAAEARLIREGNLTAEMLAFAYREAAIRVESTVTGNSLDDFTLMPYLLLRRHCYELQLKLGISVTTRALGDPESATEHTHDLLHLLKQFDDLLDRYLDERLPTDVRQVIEDIHRIDPAGETFRYQGELPDTEDHIAFKALFRRLEWAYVMLESALGMVDERRQWELDMAEDQGV